MKIFCIAFTMSVSLSFNFESDMLASGRFELPLSPFGEPTGLFLETSSNQQSVQPISPTPLHISSDSDSLNEAEWFKDSDSEDFRTMAFVPPVSPTPTSFHYGIDNPTIQTKRKEAPSEPQIQIYDYYPFAIPQKEARKEEEDIPHIVSKQDAFKKKKNTSKRMPGYLKFDDRVLSPSKDTLPQLGRPKEAKEELLVLSKSSDTYSTYTNTTSSCNEERSDETSERKTEKDPASLKHTEVDSEVTEVSSSPFKSIIFIKLYEIGHEALSQDMLQKMHDLDQTNNDTLQFAFSLYEGKKNNSLVPVLVEIGRGRFFDKKLQNYYHKLFEIYDSLTDQSLKNNLWRGILRINLDTKDKKNLQLQFLKSILGFPILADLEYFGSQRILLYKSLILHEPIKLPVGKEKDELFLKLLKHFAGDYYLNCIIFGEKFGKSSDLEKLVFLEPVIEKIWNENGLEQEYFNLVLFLMQQKSILHQSLLSMHMLQLRELFVSSFPREQGNRYFFKDKVFEFFNKIQLIFVYKAFCWHQNITRSLLSSTLTLYLNYYTDSEIQFSIPEIGTSQGNLWVGLGHRILRAFLDRQISFDDFLIFISGLNCGHLNSPKKILDLYQRLIYKVPEDVKYHEALKTIAEAFLQEKLLNKS